ncbi:MAG: alpha/beta hydrolase family protein [Pyrinomonadaceae bacterium]
MKRLIVISALIVLPLGLCVTCFSAQQSFDGHWVGTLKLNGAQERVDADFKTGQGEVKGTINFPLKQQSFTLSKFSLVASGMDFEWQDQTGVVVFNGQVTDGIISGEVRQPGTQGTLQLVRTAKIDAKIYDDYSGLYEISPNKLITIALFPPGPVYVDYETGRTGALFPLSDNTLFGGPAFILPAPMEVRITFFRNSRGEVTALTFHQNGSSEKGARKINFRKEEVTFRNGAVTLSGTLTLPNTKAPYPATVRIHGAGPASRQTFADVTSAYGGIAFLSYDKRGVGKSTGDWRTSSFENLAGDALAAIQYLKGRLDINPKQIRIGAGSEGGWVAAIVASRSPHLASIALVACPAISYVDEVMVEVENILRYKGGFSGRELERALAFQRFVLDTARTGEALTDKGWAKIESAAQKVKNEKWYSYVEPDPRDNYWWQRAPLIANFDPVPLWEKIRIPVLAVYGELDRNAPAPKNAASLEKALRKAGNRDYLIKVFPKANHEFMEAKTGFLSESLYLKRYVPGFFEIFGEWKLRRANSRK